MLPDRGIRAPTPRCCPSRSGSRLNTGPPLDASFTFTDYLGYNNAQVLADFAATHHFPAIYPFRETALAGGLIAYGPSIPDMFRLSVVYVEKILRGVLPAELPIQQPTKFELVVNLKTAKALGLTIPQSLLLRADEVID